MLNENKIVLVDIDEVMWRLLEPWIAKLDSEYNLDVKPEDCTAWDMRLLFPTLTYEQILEPLQHQEFWEKLQICDKADEYIAKLQNDGYTVKIVSATSVISAASKIPVLLKHFPTINNNDIILCEAKEFVRGDFLIDDNLANLAQRKYPILMDTYHNRCEIIPNYIRRVHNWEEAYNYIRSKTKSVG